MKIAKLTDKQVELLKDMAEVVKNDLKLLSKAAPLTRKQNVLKIAEINKLIETVENSKTIDL